MSVARFCVCGYLLPASGGTKPCPSCGRVMNPPATNIVVEMPREPRDDIPVVPLTFKAVEIGGTSKQPPPISLDKPTDARSIEEDDYARRRSDIYREVREENRRLRRLREMRGGPFGNQWPDAGGLQDCLMYPLKSIVWVLILAWAWSVLVIFGVNFAFRGIEYLIANAMVFAAGVIVLGFTHRLCQYAYASSRVGLTEMLSWPSFKFAVELKAGLRGLVGLFAGPIPVAFLAGWFWLNGGRLQFVDHLILVELIAVALTWWLLIIVSSHEFGSIHPRSILLWFDAYGWLPLIVMLVAMTIVTFILWFMASILSVGLNEGFFIQSIFLPASLVWVFAILFLLLRWLGVRVRVRAHKEPDPANANLATG
jgi:hypothetical protein